MGPRDTQRRRKVDLGHLLAQAYRLKQPPKGQRATGDFFEQLDCFAFFLVVMRRHLLDMDDFRLARLQHMAGGAGGIAPWRGGRGGALTV